MDGAKLRSGEPREPMETSVFGECDVCGGRTVERHCKIVCDRCGYIRDCSDP